MGLCSYESILINHLAEKKAVTMMINSTPKLGGSFNNLAQASSLEDAKNNRFFYATPRIAQQRVNKLAQ